MIKRSNFAVLLLAAGAGGCASARLSPPPPPNPALPYTVLDTRQATLFNAFKNTNPEAAPDMWNTMDLSQRVQYAGASRVVLQLETSHKWVAIQSVQAVHGSEPDQPSEDQFNTQVQWVGAAAGNFRKLPHWSPHIALLHPGQYGYQENRNGNPFLGLVVLFDQNATDPNVITGQYHIGFRTWFGHYEAVNGDIGNSDNYQLYKAWYGGPLGQFEPSRDAANLVLNANAAATAAAPKGPAPTESQLQTTVNSFLQDWYVNRKGASALKGYIAKDSAFNLPQPTAAPAATRPEVAPPNAQQAPSDPVQKLYNGAFKAAPLGVEMRQPNSLSEAIEFPPAKTTAPPAKSPGVTVTNDFAMYRADSETARSFVPTEKPKGNDAIAEYLYHLVKNYKKNLYVVVYTVKGPGMNPETAVSYWIPENGAWKLAAYIGTKE